jgi:hypothetical protein
MRDIENNYTVTVDNLGDVDATAKSFHLVDLDYKSDTKLSLRKSNDTDREVEYRKLLAAYYLRYGEIAMSYAEYGRGVIDIPKHIPKFYAKKAIEESYETDEFLNLPEDLKLVIKFLNLKLNNEIGGYFGDPLGTVNTITILCHTDFNYKTYSELYNVLHGIFSNKSDYNPYNKYSVDLRPNGRKSKKSSPHLSFGLESFSAQELADDFNVSLQETLSDSI